MLVGLKPEENLAKLAENSYPGRGIIVGTDEMSKCVQVYWIMGRSENSRNRIFSCQEGRVFTEAANPSKMTDPSLVIYNAMDECGGSNFIVSNGDQTDTVVQAIVADSRSTLRTALVGREFEPDQPNFTPRITGLCRIRKDGTCFTELSILKYCGILRGHCARYYYEYDQILPIAGYCLTTYVGDGNPLPSYVGEPYLMPLYGDAQEILDTYWEALNKENRIALVVKVIDPKSRRSEILIKNRFQKVDT